MARKETKMRLSRRQIASILLVATSSLTDGAIQSTELRALVDNPNSPYLYLSFDTFDGAIPHFGVMDTLFQLRGGDAAASAAAAPGVSVIPTETETPASDMEDPIIAKYSNKNKGFFSLFQKGDGSEEDPDSIPNRYMRMQKHDRHLALEALRKSLKWREEHDIDDLLNEPQVKFDLCKQVFPHYFVGRDVDGNVAFVQRPAHLNLTQAKTNRLKNEELLKHYVYVNEYLWQIIESDNPLGTMTSILDLQGLNLSVLRKTDVIGFLKVFVSTMDAHFPQRSHKTLIVNSPKWFNMLYKIISPLLRETTKAKIEILSNGKQQDKALEKQMGSNARSTLPESFWHQEKKKKSDKSKDTERDDPVELDELEKGLREYTLAKIKQAGKKMDAFV